MQDDEKKMKLDDIVSCMDALCRAYVNVAQTDPNLANDISQAIESLKQAMEGSSDSENVVKYEKSEDDEGIIDVMTGEVLYTGIKKRKEDKKS